MAIVALLLAMTPGAPALAAGVGFQKVDIPNGAEPPLTAGIWYPTDAPATPHALGDVTQTVAAGAPIAGHRLPLIVLSHGAAAGTAPITARRSRWLARASSRRRSATPATLSMTRAACCNSGAGPRSFIGW
ncbi:MULTISPECIES: hypothetical protein [unclassified Paraburkholderia]|uniref:hypothetical protein n=1 Tax=unclassified Paraburkholderia TaxID=2615204 RepID=UPI0018513CA1|nr:MULTISPECIES: hypothetical protein [unclassified Paraburkholderia]MBB5445823.1 putative dienelactone hydrolase [Paraburkholderia sp. WSM4177]MBB5486453.1 putative dienelactone hydrolase [Paraburkholderia sp. WSM4180]